MALSRETSVQGVKILIDKAMVRKTKNIMFLEVLLDRNSA
jgi:hypothetical protein